MADTTHAAGRPTADPRWTPYESWSIERIRSEFDWSSTKPDLVDRITRAIESQQQTIAACTGSLDAAREITWCDNGYHFPFDAGNFRFDAGGWADDDESVLAVRIGGAA